MAGAPHDAQVPLHSARAPCLDGAAARRRLRRRAPPPDLSPRRALHLPQQTPPRRRHPPLPAHQRRHQRPHNARPTRSGAFHRVQDHGGSWGAGAGRVSLSGLYTALPPHPLPQGTQSRYPAALSLQRFPVATAAHGTRVVHDARPVRVCGVPAHLQPAAAAPGTPHVLYDDGPTALHASHASYGSQAQRSSASRLVWAASASASVALGEPIFVPRDAPVQVAIARLEPCRAISVPRLEAMVASLCEPSRLTLRPRARWHRVRPSSSWRPSCLPKPTLPPLLSPRRACARWCARAAPLVRR